MNLVYRPITFKVTGMQPKQNNTKHYFEVLGLKFANKARPRKFHIQTEKYL